MRRRQTDGPSFDRLMALVPRPPDWQPDWAAIWPLWPELGDLDACPQDRIHHREGDVGTHTRMVVEALTADADWRGLGEEERGRVFWAAVLHDVGKPAVTVTEEDGRITSRGHSRIGASMARQFLREAGAPFAWREALCGTIAAHQLPFWLLERADYTRLAIQTSFACPPAELCLHARADAHGRICDDQARILEYVALSKSVFDELDCLRRPFAFANDESRVAFFEREGRDPMYAAHEAFRCRVTVMSGLPGSGKDTWIAANRPEHPVVSLDRIREEIGAPATGNQGRVVQAAFEAARQHLRAGQDFVWNATNISRNLRSRILRVLRDYGAHIEIVYLEVPPAVLAKQNAGRDAVVPAATIDALVRKLEPPSLIEAHSVRHICGPASD